MPIKSQKKDKGGKAQKKDRNIGKTILVSAAVLCILIVLSYLIFGRSSTSEQKTASGPVQGQQSESASTGKPLSPKINRRHSTR